MTDVEPTKRGEPDDRGGVWWEYGYPEPDHNGGSQAVAWVPLSVEAAIRADAVAPWRDAVREAAERLADESDILYTSPKSGRAWERINEIVTTLRALLDADGGE